MSWRGRLMAEDYSSPLQRSRAQFNYWQQLYWGRLRLDSIIARTLVIPDTYLLDGRFFMSTNPFDLAKNVARDQSATTPIIEVRSRCANLEDTLRNVLFRPGEMHLNRFRFNSIPLDADRETIGERLSRTEAYELERRLNNSTPARAIADLLRDLSADLSDETRETIDLLERGWTHWLSARRFPGIAIRRWEGTLSVFDGLQLEYVDPADLHSIAGEVVLRDVLETTQRSNYQSEVETVFSRYQQDASAPLVEDLGAIWRWYLRGRHRAQGLQHQCSVAHSIIPGEHSIGSYESVASDPPLDTKYFVETPEGLLTGLSNMPTEEFLRFTLANVESIQKWHMKNDRSALRKVISSLESCQAFTASYDKPDDYVLDIFSDITQKAAKQSNSAISIPGFVMTLATKPFEIWRKRSFTRRIVDYCVSRTKSETYD